MVVKELHEIQKKFGYIPEQELYKLSAKVNIPVYEIHGVATFYPGFRMQPPPKTEILVCSDFPCRLRDCHKLKSRIEGMVAGIEGVHVGNVSCLGQCDGAPAFVINDHVFARHKTIEEALQVVKHAVTSGEVHAPHLPGLKGPFKCDPYVSAGDRYGAVKDLVQTKDLPGALKKIHDSGLRGLGGAGFPTGRKWETVMKLPPGEKYIVCNADECEVGTFKDRELMKNVPHLLVEGMVLAGLVCGAERGFIYIRHEYHEQIEIMDAEIKRAYALGVCGDNVLGSGKKYQLETFTSPGGYIQGEESALIEAIEGKRGQPRVRPPLLVFSGLWGKPTIVNNVETLSYVPLILTKGPEHFKALGKNNCTGLKWIGVSGHVAKPGVWEVPMGTTYREAIYDLAGGVLGGKKLKAYAPSGPSGGFLPADQIDLCMDFNIMAKAGSMLGSTAIVAVAEGTCMLDLALNAVRFFRNESCGKCVPCRVGSQKMVDILYAMTQGVMKPETFDDIERLSDTLIMASICGLGQVVPAPIQSVIKYFKAEVEAHAQGQCPSGICKDSRGK